MRRRTLIGSLAAAGTASFSAALLYFSRQWIMPPRVVMAPPECEAFEEAEFCADDGTPLYGWLLRSAESGPGLVLCHGYQRGIEETFSLGCELRSLGFNVLLFDFRGCGRSGGRYTTLGYHEPHDARAAVEWLCKRLGPKVSIGMLGISMGGSVALTVAATCPDVRALVIDSAFSTLMGAVRQRFARRSAAFLPLYLMSMYAAERLCGGRVRDVRPVDAARLLTTTPVLLIHGTDDNIVPHTHALELDAAIPGPHALWLLDGAPHALARFRAHDEYVSRVATFFEQHLSAN